MMASPKTKAAGLDTRAALENTLHPNHTTDSHEKEFATLRAKFALAGHVLSRSNPTDGHAVYFSTRWGMCREFRDLIAVATFLEQIGGAA